MKPLDTDELQSLATQYSLPNRLLSEAQEAMLYEGWTPQEIRKDLPQLCEDAKAQGGTVEKFDRGKYENGSATSAAGRG